MAGIIVEEIRERAITACAGQDGLVLIATRPDGIVVHLNLEWDELWKYACDHGTKPTNGKGAA